MARCYAEWGLATSESDTSIAIAPESSDDPFRERTEEWMFRRMGQPRRREGPIQRDPTWRQARELGVENEYGSMFDRNWDAGPTAAPRAGMWALTPDHYFRFHAARELQFAWRGGEAHLQMSPEPSQRDIGDCLTNTPDCSCRSVLLDSLENPPRSWRLSYDPREGDDTVMSPSSSSRPPGYVCVGRDPSKHINLRLASIQGFVTPLVDPEPANRTNYEPEFDEEEGQNSQAPGSDRSREQDADLAEILSALEFLSGQPFVGRQEVDWNAEPEPRARETNGVQNVGRVVEIGRSAIDRQLGRRSRAHQNRAGGIDPLEAWRNVRNEYFWVNVQKALEDVDPWAAMRRLQEAYYNSPDPEPRARRRAHSQLQDIIVPKSADYDEAIGASVRWDPRSGDMMILKSGRHGVPWPGFDGKVEIYVDENEHQNDPNSFPPPPWTCRFEEGDVVVRFGFYSQDWHWSADPQVRVYQYREGPGRFYLVARQTMQALSPLQYRFVDPRVKVPHQKDFHFRPRWGDLIVNRGINYPFVWYVYWWDEGMPVRPSDLLVRAAYDEDGNISCCDIELYLRNPNPDFPDNWIFLGKDDYCFMRSDQIMLDAE